MERNDLENAKRFYTTLSAKVAAVREKLGRPLTLAEKILFSHLSAKPDGAALWPAEVPERGKTILKLKPDRVAMQDATAQMAFLQFMVCERPTVSVPASIHCDHLILAASGAGPDLERAVAENREVYEFLSSAAQKYGAVFWGPGSGIIHQVVLEQYAFPGGLMLGTDSHTPNAGGLGMAAVGVGGADAVDVLAGGPWSVLNPRLIGIKLTGRLKGWAAPKDVILKVAGLLTVKGGTGKIVEYFGPGASTISATGKATITNMGAELGATCSIFPYDDRMAEYLRQTERAEVAEVADGVAAELQADPEVAADPERYFDEIVELNLSELEPQWVGPHRPDKLQAVSGMKQAVQENAYPENIRYALIGSCTNSSYEDISRAASVARQARERGLKTKVPLLVTPGSDQIYKTIERDGLLQILLDVGVEVLANACGPCIGQWRRPDLKKGERNAIVTSYNRNFPKRNDGNPETLAFIGSPELVTAVAFAGVLSFDPARDTLEDQQGGRFRLAEPQGVELPRAGFVFSKSGALLPPAEEPARKALSVKIADNSERLAPLESFAPWNGQDFLELPILLKAKGQCTTDHISPAGPWLKYRGHLPKISENMFNGANNAFCREPGRGNNVFTGQAGVPFPDIARDYKARGAGWLVVGDENYGEGSSREHAAMSPRFLGCKAVITKSFARIHETNLKMQGVLPLTFCNPADYDMLNQDDRLSVRGLSELKPGSRHKVEVQGAAGRREFEVKHTLTAEQIEWFKAGSALNTLKPG